MGQHRKLEVCLGSNSSNVRIYEIYQSLLKVGGPQQKIFECSHASDNDCSKKECNVRSKPNKEIHVERMRLRMLNLPVAQTLSLVLVL